MAIDKNRTHEQINSAAKHPQSCGNAPECKQHRALKDDTGYCINCQRRMARKQQIQPRDARGNATEKFNAGKHTPTGRSRS